MIVQIATLGPLGRLKAPGTWGSAAGLLWWALVVRLAHAKGWEHELAFDALVVLTAILLCGVAAAFIVKKDPALTEAALQDFLKEQLTGYKRPKFIEFRADLPKTPVGKILRRELRPKN